MQLGIWAVGAESAILLVYDTNHANSSKDHRSRIQNNAVSQIKVCIDVDWRARYLNHAQSFYDGYLKWYHELFDVDSNLQADALQVGVAVVEMLVGKANPRVRQHLMTLS